MGKIAKIALITFAVAINVIPGVGQAISGAIVTALGGTFAALGVASIAVGVITAAATIGALSVGSSLLAKKPPKDAAAGITSRVSLDPNAGQWIVAGRSAMPTQLIYFGTDGANNERLSMIFVHSCMPITGFVSLMLNNIATAFPTPSGAYAGILSIQTTDGTQTANPFSTVRGGEWGAAHIGGGLAMSHFSWTYDKDKLASGLPQNILFVADGRPVYDPRRDSTRGGSGSMRADNQATWAFAVGGDEIGRNPALFELTYRLGWKENGRLKAGMGEEPAALDFASYAGSANVCDEIVNGKPRYRFDALIPIGPGTKHNDNLARIQSSCAGRSIDTGGLTGLWVAHDDLATVAMTLTDDDFMGSLSWAPLDESANRNTARGTYVNIDDAWQSKDYPEIAPSDLRTLDNGVELVDDLDFAGVVDVDQARRLANLRVRESRQGKFAAPVSMRALALSPTQIVAITRPRFGWSNRKFRVEAMGIGIDKVQLVLSAVQSSDYADLSNTTITAAASLPTIGFIPVLGVLALQDDVDFATQVSGAEKPADNADVTAVALPGALATTGIPGTTPVSGVTGATTLADAFSGGGGAAVGPVPIVVGATSWFAVLGPVFVEAQYTGIATGSGSVNLTLAIQSRPLGGSTTTIASNVWSGTVGDSASDYQTATAALASGEAGEVRVVLTPSGGDGINVSAPDSYWTAS